jgi:hypothetical protein
MRYVPLVSYRRDEICFSFVVVKLFFSFLFHTVHSKHKCDHASSKNTQKKKTLFIHKTRGFVVWFETPH